MTTPTTAITFDTTGQPLPITETCHRPDGKKGQLVATVAFVAVASGYRLDTTGSVIIGAVGKPIKANQAEGNRFAALVYELVRKIEEALVAQGWTLWFEQTGTVVVPPVVTHAHIAPIAQPTAATLVTQADVDALTTAWENATAAWRACPDSEAPAAHAAVVAAYEAMQEAISTFNAQNASPATINHTIRYDAATKDFVTPAGAHHPAYWAAYAAHNEVVYTTLAERSANSPADPATLTPEEAEAVLDATAPADPRCATCAGEGWIEEVCNVSDEEGAEYADQARTCPVCGGSGLVVFCQDCRQPLAAGAEHDTTTRRDPATCTLCNGEGGYYDEDGWVWCHHGATMVHDGDVCEAYQCNAPATVAWAGGVTCAAHDPLALTPPATVVGEIVVVGDTAWVVSEYHQKPAPLPTCEQCDRPSISHTLRWCGGQCTLYGSAAPVADPVRLPCDVCGNVTDRLLVGSCCGVRYGPCPSYAAELPSVDSCRETGCIAPATLMCSECNKQRCAECYQRQGDRCACGAPTWELSANELPNGGADLDDVNSVACPACFDRGGYEENGKWFICYHGDGGGLCTYCDDPEVVCCRKCGTGMCVGCFEVTDICTCGHELIPPKPAPIRNGEDWWEDADRLPFEMASEDYAHDQAVLESLERMAGVDDAAIVRRLAA